jgi:hypothetical protein
MEQSKLIHSYGGWLYSEHPLNKICIATFANAFLITILVKGIPYTSWLVAAWANKFDCRNINRRLKLDDSRLGFGSTACLNRFLVLFDDIDTVYYYPIRFRNYALNSTLQAFVVATYD